MNTKETNEKVMPSVKKNRQKKGLTYLLIALVFLVVSLSMFSAGMDSGIIFGLVSLGLLIFFLGGLIYLIGGFLGKE